LLEEDAEQEVEIPLDFSVVRKPSKMAAKFKRGIMKLMQAKTAWNRLEEITLRA